MSAPTGFLPAHSILNAPRSATQREASASMMVSSTSFRRDTAWKKRCRTYSPKSWRGRKACASPS
jgi:hypothetical protein